MIEQWLPESMRFNLSRGHVNEAIRTLESCAAENKKPMPPGRLIPPPKVMTIVLTQCQVKFVSTFHFVLGVVLP